MKDIFTGIVIGFCITSLPWMYYEIMEIKEDIAEIEEVMAATKSP